MLGVEVIQNAVVNVVLTVLFVHAPTILIPEGVLV